MKSEKFQILTLNKKQIEFSFKFCGNIPIRIEIDAKNAKFVLCG